MIDADELKSKVNPITIGFIVLMLIVGFAVGRLSMKIETQDEKFKEEILEIRTEIEYFNARVDRKMKNHEEAFHK